MREQHGPVTLAAVDTPNVVAREQTFVVELARPGFAYVCLEAPDAPGARGWFELRVVIEG